MLNTDGRHPALQEFRDAFEFDHLPEGLPRVVAASFHDHAARLLALLPDAAPLTRAIHTLWEAKNEAVLLAVRTRTGGNGSAQPPVTFRGTTDPAHAVAPVQRTELRAQDRHPDHQPGRPDGPVNAREQVATADDGLVRGGIGPKVETGRHTLNDDTPGSALRHETAEPSRSGLSFVNDSGSPAAAHEVFPVQRPGTDAAE